MGENAGRNCLLLSLTIRPFIMAGLFIARVISSCSRFAASRRRRAAASAAAGVMIVTNSQQLSPLERPTDPSSPDRIYSLLAFINIRRTFHQFHKFLTASQQPKHVNRASSKQRKMSTNVSGLKRTSTDEEIIHLFQLCGSRKFLTLACFSRVLLEAIPVRVDLLRAPSDVSGRCLNSARLPQSIR